MEIRAFEQHVQQFAGHERSVEHDVRLAVLVKIERGVRRTDRQDVNDLRPRIRRVPVKRIFDEPHLVVGPPIAQFKRPADRQWFGNQPPIAVFLNRLARHDAHHGQSA